MDKKEKWLLEDFEAERPELAKIATRLVEEGWTAESVISTLKECYQKGVQIQKARSIEADAGKWAAYLSPEERLLCERMKISEIDYCRIRESEKKGASR
jgi:hypothetical protein